MEHILRPVSALKFTFVFFICSMYLFTHSMGSFLLYKTLLSCKQESGAMIFIKHGVALSYNLNF